MRSVFARMRLLRRWRRRMRESCDDRSVLGFSLRAAFGRTQAKPQDSARMRLRGTPAYSESWIFVGRNPKRNESPDTVF